MERRRVLLGDTRKQGTLGLFFLDVVSPFLTGALEQETRFPLFLFSRIAGAFLKQDQLVT